MVGISREDQDILRFLWLKEPFKADSEIVSYRFTRLGFGLRPSPAILGAVITPHVQKYTILNIVRLLTLIINLLTLTIWCLEVQMFQKLLSYRRFLNQLCCKEGLIFRKYN